MNKKNAVLCAILSTSSINAEMLKTNSIVEFDINTTDIRAYTYNNQLQCSIDDVIKKFECGDNTTQISSTQCSVPADESFKLDYEIVNAAECWGTDGTSDWRQNLPVGTGSGQFSKTIGSLPSERIFTLNCSSQAMRYTLKNPLVNRTVDLSNIIRNSAVLAGMHNQVTVINAISGEVKTSKMAQKIMIGKTSDNALMIRQVGDEIYFIPTSKKNDISIPQPEKVINPKYSTYAAITYKPDSEIKSMGKMIDYIESGRCDNYARTNDIALNVEITGNKAESCLVDPSEKQLFLRWVVFEN